MDDLLQIAFFIIEAAVGQIVLSDELTVIINERAASGRSEVLGHFPAACSAGSSEVI